MRNKYAGDCLLCHCTVDAGAGYFQRINGLWRVRCRSCVGKGNAPLPLHVGPANMVMACGGREVTNGVTTIRIDQTGQLSGNSE